MQLGRGRDASYLSPPPHSSVRAAFPAYGSHLGSKTCCETAVAPMELGIVEEAAKHFRNNLGEDAVNSYVFPVSFVLSKMPDE